MCITPRPFFRGLLSPLCAGRTNVRRRTERREQFHAPAIISHIIACLLYTSDAADDLLCVDLGGRRFIQKKKKIQETLTLT